MLNNNSGNPLDSGRRAVPSLLAPPSFPPASGQFAAALFTVLFSMAGCVQLFSHHEVTFEKQGIEIGVETDISTRRVSPPAPNNHPARLTTGEVRTLLGSLEISGYSGTIVGIFVHPPKRPLFNETELGLIAEPIAQAFLQAGPYERVFFSIPDPDKPYDPDRIAGALFIRGPYLHATLTDHYAYFRADTGGGEDYKDPQDMKGMILGVASPAKASTPPPDQMPSWHPYETVHISLNLHDVLAARPGAPAPTQATKTEESQTPAKPARPTVQTTSSPAGNVNEDLKAQINEQKQAVESLRQEVDRLRKELPPTTQITKPGKKTPSQP